MLFSVVIPTCRRPAVLAACLARLTPAADVEIIVTDDDPADGARLALEKQFPAVRWTRGPARGPAANRNHGATLARGAWLAFTDDDCEPAPGWLAAFAAALAAQPAASLLEGRTLAAGAKPGPGWHAPVNAAGGNLWSCNFAVAAPLFARLGGFDERYPHAAMEDIDLRLRAAALGAAPLFCPAALVLHPWRREDPAHRARLARESVAVFNRLHPAAAVTPRRRLHALGVRWRRGAPEDVRRFGARGLWFHLAETVRELRAMIA